MRKGDFMAKNIGIASMAEKDILPTVESLGYKLWDVEYVREGAEMYLRVTIDSENGIGLNDCERVHRDILPILDKYEWDHLEVSSPGAERTLKTRAHFSSVVGERVEIRLFAPDENGKKSYTGTLVSCDEESITVNSDGKETVIPLSSIGKAKTVCDFENI